MEKFYHAPLEEHRRKTGMPKLQPSLSEYAASKAKPDCRVCILSERDEIDDNVKNGVPRRIILEWLWEVRGYKTSGEGGVSESVMDKHCKNKHHFKGTITPE